ncbi:MAG: Holliday junction DNA helicase RuvB [Alphaproteobacteria bacterium 40-19]|nr:MAG: Holliday junction DNA helicase RuvB [Alphaproteobacteria bacterium 40-19]
MSVLSAEKTLQDWNLRPSSFQGFIGQEQEIKNLKIFITAAKKRQDPLDHVLLHGPPGLGKTTLAHLIAIELESTFKATSAPILTKTGDLAALLTGLSPRDVLFIDEIHRLPVTIEEMLYAAMEDRKIDIMLGQGPHAKSMQLPLPPFTLIGATTRCGMLSGPLRDRFGILLPLSYYHSQELALILLRACEKLALDIEQEALLEIATRSRGTPRIALRLLKRVRDFADVSHSFPITKNLAQYTLGEMGISQEGLDPLDQRYLHVLQNVLNRGPAGIDTLSSLLNETKETLEDVVEPYLLQQGFIQKTPRGRIVVRDFQLQNNKTL